MVNYGIPRKNKPSSSSSKISHVDAQTNTSQKENSSSSDDVVDDEDDDDVCQQSEGTDVVDACLNQSSRFILEKSSSFDISPYREKSSNSWNYSPSLSLDSSRESRIHSKSMPGGLQSTRVTSSPLDNQNSKRKNYGFNSQITQSHENVSGKKLFPWVVMFVLLAILWQFRIPYLFGNSGKEYTVQHFEQDLENLSQKFKIKFDPVRLQSGIQATFEREDTSSVIFLYKYIDENEVNRFVREVAIKSAKFLRNDSASPIIVKNSDLDMQTSKELLEKYRKKLTDEGVVIFQDLEDIPVNLAMAFHYYCDEYDPLSKKTAVFFTLNMEKCTKLLGDGALVRPVDEVEECLKSKWSDLGDERLPPLLSRVVNIIITLEAK